MAGLAATPLLAGPTDFRSLQPRERAALQSEIRQVLLNAPSLVRAAIDGNAPTIPTAALGYDDEIRNDRALLDQLAQQVFAEAVAGPEDAPRVTLITAPDCPACAEIRSTLEDWARMGRLRLYLLPLASDAARQLGLDTAPSYVFETMIVRGDVPEIVLEKYIEKQGG